MIKLLQKYFSRIYVPILWTLITLTLLSLPGKMLPDEPSFKIPNLDKIVHICLFGGFVLFWCLYAWRKQSRPEKRLMAFFISFVAAVAIGITMEYVQRCCIPNRDFEIGDIVADMIGASLGYGICNNTLVVEKHSQTI